MIIHLYNYQTVNISKTTQFRRIIIIIVIIVITRTEKNIYTDVVNDYISCCLSRVHKYVNIKT